VTSTRSLFETLLGVAIAAAVAWLLPAGLDRAASREALHGVVEAPRPYQLVTGGAAPAVDVGPADVLGKLSQRGEPDRSAVGVALRRWEVNHSERWVKSLTLPVVRGPLTAAGAPHCAFSLRIGPRALDPRGGAPGLLAIFRAELDKRLPMTLPCGFVRGVVLPRPRSVAVSLRPAQGVLRLEAIATLEDTTRLGARAEFALVNRGGRLGVEPRGPIEPVFEGVARYACEQSLKVRLGSLLFGGGLVLGAARAEVNRQLTEVLARLNDALGELHVPFAPFADRPNDRITLELGGSPRVDASGVVVGLCARVDLAAPLVDRAITGPPLALRELSPPLFTTPPPRDARVELLATSAGLELVLHALWQSGALRKLGASSTLLARLPAEVEALAFEVTGFDPELPPLVDRERLEDDKGSGVPLRLANVALGTWEVGGEIRRIYGHAELDARFEGVGQRLVVHGRVSAPDVSCAVALDEASGQRGRWLLLPCLSDLAPAIADHAVGMDPDLSWDAAPLLTALARRTLLGLKLELGDVTVHPAPRGMLHASLAAKVEAAR
jgi:hypothetical protein